MIKIKGVAGSLRKNSYNRAILKEIKKNAGDDVEFEILNIDNIPLFNQDIEDAGTPEGIIKLKEKN